jgi:hypothetical protein
MKCRPKTHFTRIQTGIQTIRSSLAGKIEAGWWPAMRERGRHWLSALKRQVLVHLDLTWRSRLLKAFDRLYRSGIVSVS